MAHNLANYRTLLFSFAEELIISEKLLLSSGVVYLCSELASSQMNVCYHMSVYGSLRIQKHLKG